MSKLRVPVIVLTALVIAGLLFGSGFAVGAGYPPFDRVLAGMPLKPAAQAARGSNGTIGSDFGVFWEVWGILNREYVEPKRLQDPKQITYGAIQGLINSLDDPWTAHLDPAQFKMETSDFQGSFAGIGAQVTKENNQVTVVSPIDGSPAARAGIRPGDLIISVDGQDISRLSLTEVVEKIRGPKGTTVKLTILHQGDSRPTELELVRDDINTPSVSWKMLDEKIALVRITQFTATTSNDLIGYLKAAESEGAKGVILDLRHNPGGLLDAAVNVSSQFLKDGVVVYSVDSGGKKVNYPVRRGGVALDIPLAILVDKGSASGSEVVAGALQDAERGPLIGDETVGKGSVNQLERLSDGSALYVTVARWYTPKGRLIEGKGLSPDIDIVLSPDDIKNQNDKQLQRAIEYIKNGK